jgi:N6-adenosine-specific RNA methylase IME4
MTDKQEALVIQRKLVSIDAIRVEVAAKVRLKRNPKVIDRYANAMKNKDVFPPVVVYFDGMTNWLADGLHRLEAAKQAGLTEVEAEVREGTERDALLWAMSANNHHGLRMTNVDKMHAAHILLFDTEWGQLASREIGRLCGLDGKTVEKIRRKLSADFPQMRTVTRNGKTFMMAAKHVEGQPEQEAEPVDQQPTAPEDKAAEEPERDKETRVTVDVTDQTATVPTPEPGQTAEQGGFSVVVIAPALHPVGESQILARAVGNKAGPDDVLWMWTTTKQLPQTLATVRQWGFEYADLLTWVKDISNKKGWMTTEAEHCVIAVRGKVSVTLPGHAVWQKTATDLDSLKLFYDLVEKLCLGSKILLFASRHRDGWTSLTYESISDSFREVAPNANEKGVGEAQDVSG